MMCWAPPKRALKACKRYLERSVWVMASMIAEILTCLLYLLVYFRYIAGGINANKFGIQPRDGFKDEDCAWDWNEGAFETVKKEEAPELGERNPTYVCPFFRW